MKRLIFHVDVNSAYLSWEAAKRVASGESDLREIPSAVGGNPETRHGIILAKSIPAKKFGIKTGEPIGMALKKCPNLVLVSPDFHLYQKNSDAFMAICRKYAPVVEQYSIDECFLDMSGTEAIYPDPIGLAHQIKNEIRDTLHFTVNIGIGSNKLLAKMASDFEKPDKVHTLFTEEIPEKLWPLPIGDLFLVGKSTAKHLQEAGIRTVGDAAKLELYALQHILGEKGGIRLYEYTHGQDDSPVLAEREAPKGYSNSVTLTENITDKAEAYKVLLALADSVTTRMRADGMLAYSVSVSIRSADFKNKSHQCQLDAATDNTNHVYEIAKKLFEQLWDSETPLRLLGLSLTKVTDENYVQPSLFDAPKEEKARKIDKAVDAIRNRFGIDTIVRGTNYHSDLSVGKKHKAQLENKKKSD